MSWARPISLESLSRNVLTDSDTQVLLQEGRLIGEQRTQQRRVIDLEVITVVVPCDATGCCRGDVFGVARVHQRLPPRYANKKRRFDFRGTTFGAAQRDT